MPGLECAARAGFQVSLEVRGGPFVWEFYRHDDGPWAMSTCVATRPGIVPLESFVDVCRATYVVPRRVALASEDIDKPSAGALHMDRSGIFRAGEANEEF